MKTNPETRPVTIKESASGFKSDVASADAVRISAMSGLQRLRTAKANHADREQELLADKLGKDHPNVVRLKAEVAGYLSFGRELAAEIERATAGTPLVGKGECVVYGFVRNQELHGQPNLTVAPFDRTGQRVKEFGHTCTNDCGYFQLRYSTREASSTADESEAESETRGHGLELFLHVSNQNQEPLYLDKGAMGIVPGEAKYREIILGIESARCVPPPDALSGE